MAVGEISALLTLPELFSDESEFTVQFFIKYILYIAVNIWNLVQTIISNDYDDPYQGEFTCSDSVTNDLYNDR